MTGKTHTCLALNARAAEWVALHKAGEPAKPGHAVLLAPDGPHRSFPEALKADAGALAGTLRDACGRLPQPLTVGIPASWVLLRVLDLPEAAPQELRGMVELQVDKYAPFPADEATFAYEILDTGSGRCRLWVAAIPTATAESLGGCLKTAGLTARRIDLNLLAWWRLLRDAGKTANADSRAFLLLENDACDIVIATNGIPVAVRSLSGMEDLPPEELCDEIACELVFTLTSLDLDRAGQPLAGISVWHRGETPDLLLQRLQGQLPAPAQAFPLESLPPLAEGLSRRTHDSAPLLDLAPAAWRQAESSRRAKRRMALLTGTLLGAWAIGMTVLFGGLQYHKQRLAGMEATLAELAPAADTARVVRERVKTLEQYIERRHSALECLREVSDLLPPGIELKSLNYRKAKTLELAGEADAVSLVFDFKKEMEKSDLFVKTDLPRTQRNPQGREVFELIATLPGGERP